MAETTVATKSVKFIIKRQDTPDSTPYTEEFEIPYRANMNVISGLMEIQRNPKKTDGASTAPVCWDSNCLKKYAAHAPWSLTANRVKRAAHSSISWNSLFVSSL